MSEIISQAAPGSESPRWLTVADAAKLAKVSPGSIYKAVGAGVLRHARINRRRSLRFRPDWIDAWVDATQVPIEQPLEARGSLRIAR